MTQAFLPLVLILWTVAGCARGEVSVREGAWTLPWSVSEPSVRNPNFAAAGTHRPAGTRTFPTVELANEYLRLTVIPAIGGPVATAVHLPSGDDLFHREGAAKDWLPFWESGVKACFPYKEHGMGLAEPASWRVVRHADGGVTLAMWMEFSRHHQPWQQKMFGRYSAMLLSQHVTLRPGEAVFSVTYRIENPCPYRQGRRLWSDALFPRSHTAAGVVQAKERPPERTESELIFPAAWVSDHYGKDLRPWHEADGRLDDYHAVTNAIFAWGLERGFAGVYYPGVRVNRLRLCDPGEAPGAKFYFECTKDGRPPETMRHSYNFIELWGGSDTIFEGVEQWLGPGEAWQYRHHYAYAPGLGKVDYADPRLALNVELDGPQGRLELLPFRCWRDLEILVDDVPVAREAAASPLRPVVVSLPGRTAAEVEVRVGGERLVRQRFPLVIASGTGGQARITDNMHGPDTPEMLGNQEDLGRNYRSCLHGAGDGTVRRGRLLYRDGALAAAAACLEKALAADAEDGEGWHLLGACRLEMGDAGKAEESLRRALTAGRPYPAAGYHLAVLALGRGDERAAVDGLRVLCAAVPAHWEGRLLLAQVLSRRADTAVEASRLAAALVAEDPADPRAAWVAGGDGLAVLLREPGATVRLAEFQAVTRGVFRHPQRLDR